MNEKMHFEHIRNFVSITYVKDTGAFSLDDLHPIALYMINTALLEVAAKLRDDPDQAERLIIPSIRDHSPEVVLADKKNIADFCQDLGEGLAEQVRNIIEELKDEV